MKQDITETMMGKSILSAVYILTAGGAPRLVANKRAIYTLCRCVPPNMLEAIADRIRKDMPKIEREIAEGALDF
jgi:predicted DNA-binding transcriptional regulator